MTKRADVVAEARSWIGTPFQHQQSMKGVACDCIGLVMGVARMLGVISSDFASSADFAPYAGYARVPSGGTLARGCAKFMQPIPFALAEPGDVMLFRFNGEPTHCAIVADHPMGGLSIVHAYAPLRHVIEARLNDTWLRRAVAAYVLPGVN